MMRVSMNAVVAFRYIMKNGRGELLENSMDGLPTVYLHGSAGIQEHLQLQLEGLYPGDIKHVFLNDDDYTFEVIIDAVRQASPEELLLGYPVQVSADKCGGDCACYDV